MNFLYVLLLVAVSQASILKNHELRDIPAPTLLGVTTLHPPGFKVEWKPVESNDPDEPVLGYKVSRCLRISKIDLFIAVEELDGSADTVIKILIWRFSPTKPTNQPGPAWWVMARPPYV
jgi:hypothetical protein